MARGGACHAIYRQGGEPFRGPPITAALSRQIRGPSVTLALIGCWGDIGAAAARFEDATRQTGAPSIRKKKPKNFVNYPMNQITDEATDKISNIINDHCLFGCQKKREREREIGVVFISGEIGFRRPLKSWGSLGIFP